MTLSQLNSLLTIGTKKKSTTTTIDSKLTSRIFRSYNRSGGWLAVLWLKPGWLVATVASLITINHAYLT